MNVSSNAGSPSTGVDVLIAEDSRMQARLLQKKLAEAGHSVRWGENGADALAMARERKPDIIISDIEMPVMTGYEFCKAVKTDPLLKGVPFILLSTLADPIDIIRGLDAGADNYVTKPYEPAYLLGRVDSLHRFGRRAQGVRLDDLGGRRCIGDAHLRSAEPRISACLLRLQRRRWPHRVQPSEWRVVHDTPHSGRRSQLRRRQVLYDVWL